MFLLRILLCAFVPNIALSSSSWWIPEHFEDGGEYLCICSGNLVTSDSINNNGRGCIIDNTLERHRYMCAYFREFQIFQYLESCTSKLSPIRVLHNAPEMSIAVGFNFFQNPHVDYVGFDYFVGPLVYKTPMNEFKFDIENIPFPDEYFHMIISSHVLEHVKNLENAISELYRVLKPGGIGFIAFPANFKYEDTIEDYGDIYTDDERVQKFGQKDHVRLIGKDILALFRYTGFEWDYKKTHRPKGFFQRPEISANLIDYKNAEFRATYNEQVFFVYKPGIQTPPPLHMVTDDRRPNM